jgi:hypothetical protein
MALGGPGPYAAKPKTASAQLGVQFRVPNFRSWAGNRRIGLPKAAGKSAQPKIAERLL